MPLPMGASVFLDSANLSSLWIFGLRKRNGVPMVPRCSSNRKGLRSGRSRLGRNYSWLLGLSILSQSLPLCLKMVVVSVASFRRNPVASSTLSNANTICSPSTASIGWSDITTFAPILPVNMPDGCRARFVQTRFGARQIKCRRDKR